MMNKEGVIDTGANIAGALVSASLSAAFPQVALLGEIIGPVVTMVTEDVLIRALSHAETDRITSVRNAIIAKIQQRLDAGDQPRREDDFYLRDEYYQSSATKLLEETLLKTKQEYEAKKLMYYSNFFSNICFANNVAYETANSIISQFALLSYQQVKILAYLNTDKTLPLNKWEKQMYVQDTLAPYYMFFSDCLYLYNIRLASNPSMKLGVPEISISHSGKLMCDLLEIVISEQELSEIAARVADIERIVERLK